jgi:hypothetical protein
VHGCSGLLKAEKDKGHGLRELITAAGGSIAAGLSKDFAGRGGIALGDEHKVLLQCLVAWQCAWSFLRLACLACTRTLHLKDWL